MRLLEIKNNLIKISYTETENPVLGRFIVLASDEKSYVAQFVNLKSDTVNNFAIAKLLFTFTSDGVVDNYDGSIPNINAELSFLPAEELLDLLPIETAIKIGNLAQEDSMLNLDLSVFERNLTVFSERTIDRTTFISNCVRQLFQLKEKSVIIDADNMFEDYEKIKFTQDFKLPLNSKMIDYIFEYELTEVDAATKAVIQDIFYAVQQYIKSMDFEFLPIDNFVDVVANQYKEMQMPELALLKNKLLKYRDANIFANTKDEVLALKNKLEERNCSIIDIKAINESLQKEVISFIHKTLENFDKYVYFFVGLTDDNSDKLFLKQLINNNHVFTVFFASSEYKYAQELKQNAQNMILFAPQSTSHDFAAFNTFINKLNSDECIVYGKLTQGIPFIVEMSELELDLTKDDVLGDKYQFVPTTENLQLVQTDEFGYQTPVDLDNNINIQEETQPEEYEENTQISEIPTIAQPPIEVVDEPQIQVEELPAIQESFEAPQELTVEEPIFEEVPTIMPSEPIVEELPELEQFQEPNMLESEFEDTFVEEPTIVETNETQSLQDDDLMESFEIQEEQLTENDLDFIEDSQTIQEELIEPATNEDFYEESPYVEEQPPVVPVYPVEEPEADETSIEFNRGDSVNHPRYGRGVIEKIIKYGNKTLCSIAFDNVGRRLLDPTISELTRLS